MKLTILIIFQKHWYTRLQSIWIKQWKKNKGWHSNMYSIANWYIVTHRLIFLKTTSKHARKFIERKWGGGVAKMAQIPTGLSVKYDFKFSFLQLKSIITSNYIIQFCIYTISNYSKFVYLNNLTKIRLFISLFAIYSCLCT